MMIPRIDIERVATAWDEALFHERFVPRDALRVCPSGMLTPVGEYRQYPGASAHICKLQVYYARQGFMSLKIPLISQYENNEGARNDVDHPF